MIVIIDYGMGNLRSVQKTFERIKVPSIISSNKNDILSAEKLILPGVGHFGKGMRNLAELDLIKIINMAVFEKKTPILGICLGMQLMAKHSEEGNIDGLGWFDANVIQFRVNDTIKFKVPHMGWNQVGIVKESSLFKDVDLSPGFYFVHSYHILCNDLKDALNVTDYVYPFTSAVLKDNIIGLQYHPEKSHDAGEQLLKNFTEM